MWDWLILWRWRQAGRRRQQRCSSQAAQLLLLLRAVPSV